MTRQQPEAIGLVSNATDREGSHDSFSDDDDFPLPDVKPRYQPGSLSRFLPPSFLRLKPIHIRIAIAAAAVALFLFGWTIFGGESFSGTFDRHEPPPPPKYQEESGLDNNPNLDHPQTPHPIAPSHLQKPSGTKVIGLVFYGRRSRSSILECYLRRNLAVNGGWLDEVLWGVNTNNQEDINYLDTIIETETTGSYRKVQLPPEEHSYYGLWHKTVHRGNIYVKIDDDVVYIADDAVPLIVTALVANKDAIMVSSNMVNSPKFSWLQYRTGAILPYLPEVQKPSDISTKENPTWKASDLPSWKEPRKYKAPPEVEGFYPLFRDLMPASNPPFDPKTDHFSSPHRWLPLRQPNSISKTPIIFTEFRENGKALFNWIIAAQQHYSFFENMENDNLDVYHLVHHAETNDETQGMWDQTGERISINMIAIRAETILDNLKAMQEYKDDEGFLTQKLPGLVNKRILVQLRALAAHYSFNRQGGLDGTDVLSRYRAYAIDRVCGGTLIDPVN